MKNIEEKTDRKISFWSFKAIAPSLLFLGISLGGVTPFMIGLDYLSNKAQQNSKYVQHMKSLKDVYGTDRNGWHYQTPATDFKTLYFKSLGLESEGSKERCNKK